MDSHKGALTLIIAVLLLFAAWVTFGDKYVKPTLNKTGEGFETMVDGVFETNGKITPGLGEPGLGE